MQLRFRGKSAAAAPQPEFFSAEADLGKFRSPSRRLWFLPRFFSQMAIMMKRNAILQMRFTGSTLTQVLLVPFLVHLLLFILQQADYSNQSKSNPHPLPSTLSGVPLCQGRNPGNPCITIMYAPPIQPYTSFMQTFASLNANRTGAPAFTFAPAMTYSNSSLPTSVTGIVPVPDSDFIFQYALNNTNTTRWAVVFNNQTSTTSNPTLNIQYQLWFNTTLSANGSDPYGREILSMMRGLDEAIISNLNDPTATVTANIDVSLKDWPLIPPSTLSDNVVSTLGAVFFFCSEMVIFINVLNQIVVEKEMKLRIALEMSGLGSVAYWLSTYLSATVLVFLNSLVTSIFGYIFNFNSFKNTNFGVLLVLFFLFGEAMVALAFFIACFVRRARVGILIGIFLFIIGLVFESFVFSSAGLGYIWWDASAISQVAWQVLIFVPFFNFGKCFLDIQQFTTGSLDTLTQTYTPGPGFSWNSLYSDVPTLPGANSGGTYTPPHAVQSFYYLIMNSFLFFFAALYFDKVIPNEFGKSTHVFFFLDPRFWGISFRKGERANFMWLESVLKRSGGIEVAGLDEEVLREKAKAVDPGIWPSSKIVNLRKSFYASMFYASKSDKIAVKDVCFTFEEGSLLALLGQNGAGKTTTMNILSGLSPASNGDALLYGLSVKNEMSRINELMGVCPQHDILFPDLTAIEHIELYAGLKGVDKKDWAKLAEDRLKCVRLWNVRNARSGTYSGGMKRRLSMVVATIGDPKIIFLDEPTTGMDPVNRRHVWGFIENFKAGRVMVLTTHSMEEADVLGDRIAIMAHGAIRALGNSISLKAKYGAGYRINLMVNPGESAKVKDLVINRVPGVFLEDESAESLIFQFPTTSQKHIPEFVQFLEEDGKKEGIKAWGISQTTLEEVFLRIIKNVDPNAFIWKKHQRRIFF